MKIVYSLLVLFLIPFIISCGTCKNNTENIKEENIQKQNNPTSIVQNVSVVTARVDEVILKTETDYKIKVTVLTVEEKSDKPSIAVPGNEYVLQPNFYYDNNKLVENDVNDSLKKLSKLEKGKTFKAEISLENQKGWFIQKVLKD
jgi:hypothetical protein